MRVRAAATTVQKRLSAELIKITHARIHKDGSILFGVLCRNERSDGKLHVTILATNMGIKPLQMREARFLKEGG